MESAASTTVLIEDTDTRQRARERLYVILQLSGWGFFLGIQLFVEFYFGTRDSLSDRILSAAITVMVMAQGLLLTHYVRPLVARWGWKQLGWRQLIPRIFLTALVMSAIWSIVGYGYCYGIVRLPWPSEKFSPFALVALSTVNGTMLYTGWFCVYFFYHLFDRYNRSEIERLRLSTNVKEAELRALKSQVNPHFIFNSLNSLRALIDENPTRAREAVTQLANLLRYSLQSGQLETVPFEEELRIVNDYLALEQVRHEERLRVRLDIDPATLTLPIPPLLLQTLVENAVKYGISDRPEGGEIAIVARRESDALMLRVTNPGDLSTPNPRRRVASTGVGLRNAAERLRLLFGEKASLKLRADGPSLVVAEAVVPLTLSRV